MNYKSKYQRVKSERNMFMTLLILMILLTWCFSYFPNLVRTTSNYKVGFQDGKLNCPIPTEIKCIGETYSYTYYFEYTNLINNTRMNSNNFTVLGCKK